MSNLRQRKVRQLSQGSWLVSGKAVTWNCQPDMGVYSPSSFSSKLCVQVKHGEKVYKSCGQLSEFSQSKPN